MMSLIFVYGTLKEGFANFGINGGKRVPGEYETALRFPLYVIGQHYVPWLVEEPGVGHHVSGQVYEVGRNELSRMDELERISEPGWYSRAPILVLRRDAASREELETQVYFGSRSRLESDVVHVGPLEEFTLEHDEMYRSAPLQPPGK